MDAKEIAEGLKKAMQDEAYGHHFYMMAAKTTEDEQGKEIFAKLAQDEMDHFNFLKAHYKSFCESEKPAAVKLSSPQVPKGGIFSDAIKKRIKDAHYEMTALSVGIQLELSAVKYYKEQADKAGDETVKEFYNELSRWEAQHYEILLNQQEALREDYWGDLSFSPF